MVMVQTTVMPNGVVVERHYSAARNPQSRAQQPNQRRNPVVNLFGGMGGIFDANDMDAFFNDSQSRPQRALVTGGNARQGAQRARREQENRIQVSQRDENEDSDPMSGFMDLFGIMNHPFLQHQQSRNGRQVSMSRVPGGRMIIVSSGGDEDLANHQSFMRSHRGDVLNQTFINSLLEALIGGHVQGGDQAAPRAMNKKELGGLKVTKYKKPALKAGEEEEKCPICCMELENGVEIKKLPCKHTFHPGCIDTWLVRNCTCPICKRDVKDLLEGRSTN